MFLRILQHLVPKFQIRRPLPVFQQDSLSRLLCMLARFLIVAHSIVRKSSEAIGNVEKAFQTLFVVQLEKLVRLFW